MTLKAQSPFVLEPHSHFHVFTSEQFGNETVQVYRALNDALCPLMPSCRLYSSAVFHNEFEQFSAPEISRRPVDDLMLQMKVGWYGEWWFCAMERRVKIK